MNRFLNLVPVLILCLGFAGCSRDASLKESKPILVVRGNTQETLEHGVLTPSFVLYSDGLVLSRESTKEGGVRFYRLQLDESDRESFEKTADAVFLSAQCMTEMSQISGADSEDAYRIERLYPEGSVEFLVNPEELNKIEWVGAKVVVGDSAARLPKELLSLLVRIRELESSVDRTPASLMKDAKGNLCMPGVANLEPRVSPLLRRAAQPSEFSKEQLDQSLRQPVKKSAQGEPKKLKIEVPLSLGSQPSK